MPHLIIEYSKNLASFDPASCLAATNAALIDSGHFQEADIKSRAIRLDTFLVGSGSPEHAFIAARLYILPGRSLEIKQDLSTRLVRALQQQLPAGTGLRTQISVETLDIERPGYTKAVVES